MKNFMDMLQNIISQCSNRMAMIRSTFAHPQVLRTLATVIWDLSKFL